MKQAREDDKMKKKLIALGMLCMFLLTSITVGTAIGNKTTEVTSEPGVDLAVEIRSVIDATQNNKPIGLVVVVTNIGSETVTGPISGTFYVKLGYFGLITRYTENYEFLENGQSLSLGQSTPAVYYLANLLGPGFHINLFRYELKFNDENPDNNICSQRAISVSILYPLCRMYFI